MIRCMVVDDEPLAREVLVRFIARVPSLTLVAECSNALQAMAILQQKEIDVLLLDIQMPELLGTDLLRILQRRPKVILTTAYPEYALEGYELDVLDYLLKPIQFERFLKAINKLSPVPSVPAQPPDTNQQPHEGYCYFRTDRKMTKVMLNDILYIEGMKNYVRIITQKQQVITKSSITAVEAMLPEAAFIRIHRSYIISKEKVAAFTNESVTVGTAELPIGQLFRNEVMKRLK
jgi:two-component system LytT family response regulator